ncbi:MAG: hypothetical protein LBU15_02100 [Rickettsiales bacterium]|nr:hypothetical protein [Rickettsiales bacterium]
MTFRRLENGRKFNNYDLLKDIAFITMIIDHLGLFVFSGLRFLRVIGRASALIYAFLFGISRKRNGDRILTAAVVTSLVWAILLDRIFPLNVLYNFYLSSFLLDRLERLYSGNIFAFSAVLLVLLASAEVIDAFLEYGSYFLLLIFCGRLCRKREMTRRDKTVVALLVLAFFRQQALHMEFSLIQSLCLFVIFLTIYLTFINFRLRELENIPKRGLLLFLSRYSVELFVLQHIFFITLLCLRWTLGKT